jgi:hypothetical protein
MQKISPNVRHSSARAAEYVVMAAKERSNPTFEPHKAEDGTGYYVLVTWPDGGMDRIGGLFKDETAALDWIRVGSRAWIARRKKSRRPPKMIARL